MKSVFAVLGLTLLAGCHIPESIESPEQSEPAKVTNLLFVPSGDGSGTGIGFSSKGSVVITSNSVHIPARYGIVFQCQHGSFAVEGRESVWKTLHVGEDVLVKYTEKFEYYKDTGEKNFTGYHFITAVPANAE